MIQYENLNKLNNKFKQEFIKNISEFFDNDIFILGNSVKNFEKEFSEYCGTKYCVGVASGLDALILSLKVLNLPKDSEVIVPSNTYIATILAILQNNLKPVFVEPDINSYNIDVNKIEQKITEKTKCILCVHLYGKSCDMDELIRIKNKYNLYLIEDSSQAHGAEYNNKKIGSFGDLSAFSLYPTKNLGALGDAGCITTDNEEFYDKLIYYRNYGSKIKYHNKYIGFNSRLDELQAKFLLVKLKYLDDINNHKIKLAKLYNDNLDKKYIKPIIENNKKDVYHIYNIRFDKRDMLKEYLKCNDIFTEIHYPISPNNQECLKNIISEKHPISELIHNTTLSLPISYIHTEEDVYKVIEKINNFNI